MKSFVCMGRSCGFCSDRVFVCCSIACCFFACGEEPGREIDTLTCQLLQGDLAISEILVDPIERVEDGVYSRAPEWIEIYNATFEPRQLSGLQVSVAGAGSPRQFDVDTDALLDPGSYFVLGGQSSQAFDYVDHATGLQLANSGAVIELRCNGILVDRVAYGNRGTLPPATKGKTLSYSGELKPSALENDIADRWCTSADLYDGFNAGTPGASNAGCAVGGLACDAFDIQRALIPPGRGDLVITEVFANPEGADSLRTREWFEIYNAASAAVDLNGLRIVSRAGHSREFTVESGAACVSIAPGAYAVIGASDDTRSNGAVDVDAVAPGLELYNSESTLEIFNGDRVVDAAEVPDAVEGASAFVSTNEADSNDTLTEFCYATVAGIFDGLGSPGRPNPICEPEESGENPGSGSERCRDSGVERSVRSPAVGDVVIAEVHADPSGSDAGKEYIELLVSTGSSVDLNGLTVVARSDSSGNERSFSIDLNECQSFGDGRLVVGSSNPNEVSGTPLDVDLRGNDAIFYNSPQRVRIELHDGTVIDAAQLPTPESGVALRAANMPLTHESNDVPSAWCAEGTAGVFEDFGSPGTPGVCAQ